MTINKEHANGRAEHMANYRSSGPSTRGAGGAALAVGEAWGRPSTIVGWAGFLDEGDQRSGREQEWDSDEGDAGARPGLRVQNRPMGCYSSYDTRHHAGARHLRDAQIAPRTAAQIVSDLEDLIRPVLFRGALIAMVGFTILKWLLGF